MSVVINTIHYYRITGIGREIKKNREKAMQPVFLYYRMRKPHVEVRG